MQNLEMQVNLKTSVRYLKGVGPERAKVLMRLGLITLGDLFYFFPRRYEDRVVIKNVSEIAEGEKECVKGVIASRGLVRTRHGQTIFRIVLSERDKTLFCSWFNQPYLTKVFQAKASVALYGKVEKEGRHFQMVHPEYELFGSGETEGLIHFGRIVPVYPLTEDLSQKGLRQFIFRMIGPHLDLLRDPVGADIQARTGISDYPFSFKNIHFPESEQSFEKAYRRLVFDEFFLMQVLIQMKKQELQRQDKNISHGGGEETLRKFMESLRFELTEGQKSAIAEIVNDMKKDRPMNRLVQGDVGSGKTVVAAAALLYTVQNDFQGALMAPTEVLAQQHYYSLSTLLEPLGVTCGLLMQGMPPEEKKKVTDGLLSGQIKAVIGTHALIQQGIKFKRLGLAVIDEQHKFGVFQRAALKEKGAGRSPHLLLMTATPIPRTLAMTLYGDLDISTIRELPKGRKPVKTLWVGNERRGEIYALLDSLTENGGQGYVICPEIDGASGDAFSPKSVLASYKELMAIFSHRKVGVLHGRMKPAEKKKIMQNFKERHLEILVSTVVIEVGVDVPNASVMIIENAERFGLAQLHQLRGRVGRGSEESYCVLFSDTKNEESIERLEVFQATQSGFEIAEKDLVLRGSGDIVGERQHGWMELRIGDFVKDAAILELARREAMKLVEKDPCLELPANKRLKQAMVERFKVSPKKLIEAGAVG